jgi:hypothetical protein
MVVSGDLLNEGKVYMPEKPLAKKKWCGIFSFLHKRVKVVNSQHELLVLTPKGPRHPKWAFCTLGRVL